MEGAASSPNLDEDHGHRMTRNMRRTLLKVSTDLQLTLPACLSLYEGPEPDAALPTSRAESSNRTREATLVHTSGHR